MERGNPRWSRWYCQDFGRGRRISNEDVNVGQPAHNCHGRECELLPHRDQDDAAGRSHQDSLGAAGLEVVVLSTSYPLTLLGLAGMGLSGIVPQIFPPAENISEANTGVIMCRVVGAGYVAPKPAVEGINSLSGTTQR